MKRMMRRRKNKVKRPLFVHVGVWVAGKLELSTLWILLLSQFRVKRIANTNTQYKKSKHTYRYTTLCPIPARENFEYSQCHLHHHDGHNENWSCVRVACCIFCTFCNVSVMRVRITPARTARLSIGFLPLRTFSALLFISYSVLMSLMKTYSYDASLFPWRLLSFFTLDVIPWHSFRWNKIRYRSVFPI